MIRLSANYDVSITDRISFFGNFYPQSTLELYYKKSAFKRNFFKHRTEWKNNIIYRILKVLLLFYRLIQKKRRSPFELLPFFL